MILEIKNLVKRYGEFLAIDNVNLKVEEGEILGLLGPNGAGKTTTINTILGLLSYDSGEISIFERNLRDSEKEIKSNIGVVPQNIALYYELTAYENLDLFGRLYGLKGRALTGGIEDALEFTGLKEKRNGKVHTFSGGMKRRLNIACALVHKPKFIIMDEPTVGIDPQSRNYILEAVRKLNENGCTIIYTSHYMEEVEALCNKIAIMDQGKMIAYGSKDELRNLVSHEDVINVILDRVSYKVKEELSKLDGVIEVNGDGKSLEIILDKHRNMISQVVEIIARDNKMVSINMEKQSLERVFLTLTGRKLRD